ncbi:MAG TPA: LacI family DNA-binding transcriptional regulator [Opitutaceae bacterium]|nr:LacI family DNA-binding transcriptional regulator [Opitutaceae bacterium]
MARSTHKKPSRAATLADVGRAAGVSAMAASAVLNGARTSSRISPSTRERIIEAAGKLRYRPNAAARALVHQRMNTIGVSIVIDGGAQGELNQYFLEIFNGVIESAAVSNQNTTVLALHDWQRDLYRLAGFCDGRVDGVILIAPRIPSELSSALPEHTPFVALHSDNPLPNVVNLESDEETGAFQIVQHLISQGHRRIVHMCGDQTALGAQRRIRGYRKALSSARIPFDPTLLIETGFSQIPARPIVRNWLKTNIGRLLPDAIFTVNDGVGLACLEVLAEAGIKVPEHVSLVGFDDTLAARIAVPQLTTVRQPLRAMGSRAVELLLDRIHHKHGGENQIKQSNVVFPTELVLRASVGTPSATPKLIPQF